MTTADVFTFPADATLLAVLDRLLGVGLLRRADRDSLLLIQQSWEAHRRLTPDTRAFIAFIAECYAEEVTL